MELGQAIDAVSDSSCRTSQVSPKFLTCSPSEIRAMNPRRNCQAHP